MPSCEIWAKIHQNALKIRMKLIKSVEKIEQNINKNLNQKNRKVNKNIEILYNKAKIINHSHLTSNKINSLFWK